MSWEKSGDPRILKRWYGHMEVQEYIYTVGVAGEIFFKNLKEKGVLTGGRCKKCNIIYMPARAYCELCFSEITEWVEFEPRGLIETYTIVYFDKEGKRLEEPKIVAFISIPGTHGGIIHFVGEVKPEDVDFDMEVEAVLKPPEEREGNILDIKYFKPVEYPRP